MSIHSFWGGLILVEHEKMQEQSPAPAFQRFFRINTLENHAKFWHGCIFIFFPLFSETAAGRKEVTAKQSRVHKKQPRRSEGNPAGHIHVIGLPREYQGPGGRREHPC